MSAVKLVRAPSRVAVTATPASPAVVALQRSRLSRTLADVAAAIVRRDAAEGEQGRGAA